MTSPLETAIFDLLAARDSGKSICPSEAARAVDADGWRRLMPQVRATAVGLVRAGRLEITRKGRVVDPDMFKGVYRLRLPKPPSGTQSAGTDGEPDGEPDVEPDVETKETPP